MQQLSQETAQANVHANPVSARRRGGSHVFRHSISSSTSSLDYLKCWHVLLFVGAVWTDLQHNLAHAIRRSFWQRVHGRVHQQGSQKQRAGRELCLVVQHHAGTSVKLIVYLMFLSEKYEREKLLFYVVPIIQSSKSKHFSEGGLDIQTM